ncbi:MAG: sigma 54-interacting transcriptional regulator [Weizmannia coagulans]|jgi:transcriptional regulator with PAS, ATPase and Fis domain|nr:sigma 54-interacting transcriptional regulator [Heyndrickxia coagulans]
MAKPLYYEKTESMLKAGVWMSPCPYVIRPGTVFREAACIMRGQNLSSLVVTDETDQPVGMLTLHHVLAALLDHMENEPVLRALPKRNFAAISEQDSLLDVLSLPFSAFPVVNENRKCTGILTRQDLLDGLAHYIRQMAQTKNTAEILNAVLESAYEGIAVVDENGILIEFNEAYSRFTGIKREDAIGRHVTEVIENTNLHVTVKTAIPERGVIQYIQGQAMVVHRIPIWKGGRVVGAIGMLIFEGVSELYQIFERLQQDSLSARKEKTGSKKMPDQAGFTQILGTSESISRVKRLARRAARTSATVLITGESGTGKELFAKSIHQLSPYARGPFITVNCGAIPEPLFESELFGYEEGAFTGAKKGGKPGKFELAENGTLFLDEIGELSPAMQTKLLRAIQEKEAERVGGVKKYKTNVRIVAATNRNLEEMVEAGTFRADLYYRLNIIRIHLPPLRERKEDIPGLVSHFLKAFCRRYDLPEKRISSEAVAAMMAYGWKGNVRELANTVERLVTLADGPEISRGDLPEAIHEVQPAKDIYAESLISRAREAGEAQEKALIIRALKNAGGNKTKAAELLGIHRTTLYQKIKKYNL